VSMSTTSASCSMPVATASKATLAGSACSLSERTTCAPTRSPQVWSWSAAAARNVSAAPSTTVSPSPTSDLASLPQVVVLPVPFTPTTSTTAGRPSCRWVRSARLASVSTWVSSSVRSMALDLVRGPCPLDLDPGPQVGRHLPGGHDPDIGGDQDLFDLVQVSSSSRSLDSRARSAVPKPPCDLASRARSLIIRPAEGGGFSRVGLGGAAGACGASKLRRGRRRGGGRRSGPRRGLVARLRHRAGQVELPSPAAADPVHAARA